MSESKTKMFTTQQASQLIGISDSRLRNLIRVGQAVPAEQIGGTWLFTLDEINRLKVRPGQRKRKADKAA